MKNKSMTVVLAVIAIGVWGAVLLKVVSSVGNLNTLPGSAEYITQDIEQSIEVDTFTLLSNYRDPFGGHRKPKSKVKPKSKLNKISTPKLPSIEYLGLIKNKTQKIILIRLNDENRLSSEGAFVGDIQMMKSFDDSIEVKYMDRKYWIKKSN